MQTEVDSHHASGLVEPKGQERKGTQNLACVTSLECQTPRQGREMEERREGGREQGNLHRGPMMGQIHNLHTTLPDGCDHL